jgi:hypothetical protein
MKGTGSIASFAGGKQVRSEGTFTAYKNCRTEGVFENYKTVGESRTRGDCSTLTSPRNGDD